MHNFNVKTQKIVFIERWSIDLIVFAFDFCQDKHQDAGKAVTDLQELKTDWTLRLEARQAELAVLQERKVEMTKRMRSKLRGNRQIGEWMKQCEAAGVKRCETFRAKQQVCHFAHFFPSFFHDRSSDRLFSTSLFIVITV